MGTTWSQFFPPTPALTGANLPRQDGKVFIVTGATSGVGFELAKLLYQAGGKVYIAGRSESSTRAAVSKISAEPSAGSLAILPLSLDDLCTIKPAASRFLAAESRLDVLFNNAGVSNPPAGSLSAQGHELQLATNCLGPYLLTQLLEPVLAATAQLREPGAVRVVWTSSIVVDLAAPTGGMDPAELAAPRMNDQQRYYGISKTGNWFLADGLARQMEGKGVLSVTQNPGNLKTALLRHLPGFVSVLVAPLLYEARYGAYTELWAGLAEELGMQDAGGYVMPWGRRHPAPRADLLGAMASKDEGGTGVAEEFLEWCRSETWQFR